MNGGMRGPTRGSLLVAACGALACAEEEPQLCDGSAEVRWAAHQTFGARDWVPPFIAEYGSGGIRIDGHCQFWLYDTSLRGLRRGVIGAALERSIMYWSNYGSYASFYDPSFEGVCLDAGGAWVSDGTATLGSCVSPEAPSGWKRAVGSASYVARELDAISEPVWRPIQILPLANPNVLPKQPVYDWNAPFDLAAHAVTYSFDEALDRDITSIPVDDPAVLARLDELRILGVQAADDAGRACACIERGLFVRDADGRIFQLFIRDEQPKGLFADPARR